MSTDTIVRLYAAHIRHLQKSTQRALEECDLDAVVIHSGRAQKIRDADDQYWPVAPTPAFAHWLPAIEAGSALVISRGAEPTLLRRKDDDFWDGPPRSESEHYRDYIEVIEVAPEELSDKLPSGRVAFIGDDARDAEDWQLRGKSSLPLENKLDAVRAIKTAYERACIAEANRRASHGHNAVLDRFKSSEASEFELHLHYLNATAQDAYDTPYKNIVALGRNAATLHHVSYSRTIAPSERSLLIDAGATCLGYASDITRTAVIGDSAAASQFAELVSQMESIQQELCALLRPGIPYEDLHEQAHQLLAKVLLDVRLATGSSESLVASGVTRAFFPHGLGHSLGLQVHDVGCREVPPSERNPFLRTTATVAPGHVFTIEPGCYFIDALLLPLRSSTEGKQISWDDVDRLRPFGGIRIEDNLAVLDGKAVNLTRDNWGGSP